MPLRTCLMLLDTFHACTWSRFARATRPKVAKLMKRIVGRCLRQHEERLLVHRVNDERPTTPGEIIRLAKVVSSESRSRSPLRPHHCTARGND